MSPRNEFPLQIKVVISIVVDGTSESRTSEAVRPLRYQYHL